MIQIRLWLLGLGLYGALYGQVRAPLGGLIAVPVQIDSSARDLLLSSGGPAQGIGRHGLVFGAGLQQPYGLEALRTQSLWMLWMRETQAGGLRIEQVGSYPLQSLEGSIDYARKLNNRFQLGIRQGIERRSAAGRQQIRVSSQLQVVWQLHRFIWVEGQARRDWQRERKGAGWTLHTQVGIAWPSRGACVLGLTSRADGGIQIDWRGQFWIEPRFGLYVAARPVDQSMALGWWLQVRGWQFLMIGQYHSVLGITPQLSVQYQLPNRKL